MDSHRQGASVAGMDGFTHHVNPYDEDLAGNETYLLRSEERGGFVLTECGLEELGSFDLQTNITTANQQFAIGTLLGALILRRRWQRA